MKSLRNHIKNLTLAWFIVSISVVIGVFIYYSALMKYKESERTRSLMLDEIRTKFSLLIEDEVTLSEFLLNEFIAGERNVPERYLDRFQWFVFTKNDVILSSNHPQLELGGIFSPNLSWKNGAGFGMVSILGRDYFVVASRRWNYEFMVAIDFSELGKLLPDRLGDVYIVSTNGKIIGGGENRLNGLTISVLGVDLKDLKFATRTEEIRKGFRDFSCRFEPHGFYILSVYNRRSMLKGIMLELLPYILGLSVGLLVYIFFITQLTLRSIMRPVDKIVADINEGRIPIETEYTEFESISNALEEFIIRLKSIYQGLRFTATLEFDVDLNDPEADVKTIRKFELSLPMVFRKYRAIAYYSVQDDHLELVSMGGHPDEISGILEKFGKDYIPINRIKPLLQENPLTAIWMSFRDLSGHVLMIPLYSDRILRYVVMIYIDEVASKTEAEAGEILVLEYNLILDQINILRKLNTLATTDFLTGLKNRMYFMSRLEEECERAKRYGIGPKSFGVFMVDLDGLKRVNDTFGHEAGDEYIKTFADYLKKITRKSDVAGRLGGDEFGIIWVNVDENDLKIIEKRLLEGLEKIRTPKYGLKISVSLGSALYGVDGTTPDELLNRADLRMYKIKERKKARDR